jgi:hypothetical protein
MSAFVGYIIGVTSSVAGYLAYRWLADISYELDNQEEIVRILDYLGVEDEIYPLFKPKHLPQLRALEKVYDAVEMFDCLEWCVTIWARLIVMNKESIEMLTSELPCFMLTWSTDNILSTARLLASLDLNTQSIENAASALNNFDKYNAFLGDQSLIMSAYLNNPKFSELIDRVIYQYQPSENDEDSFDHIYTIVQKINNIVFSLVINLAVEINKPDSEILQTFEMINKLYNQFLKHTAQNLKNSKPCGDEPQSDAQSDAQNDTQNDTQNDAQLGDNAGDNVGDNVCDNVGEECESPMTETTQQDTQSASQSANHTETDNHTETVSMSDIDDLPSITA